MMASKAYSQIATVRANEMKHRKDTETKRQASERVKLEESYRIESERFDVEWAQKMKDVEERCRLKLVELAELLPKLSMSTPCVATSAPLGSTVCHSTN